MPHFRVSLSVLLGLVAVVAVDVALLRWFRAALPGRVSWDLVVLFPTLIVVSSVNFSQVLIGLKRSRQDGLVLGPFVVGFQVTTWALLIGSLVVGLWSPNIWVENGHWLEQTLVPVWTRTAAEGQPLLGRPLGLAVCEDLLPHLAMTLDFTVPILCAGMVGGVLGRQVRMGVVMLPRQQTWPDPQTAGVAAGGDRASDQVSGDAI